jgi:hypothetical protein
MPRPGQPEPAHLATIVQWGANTRCGSIADRTQTAMARHAFEVLATIVDDPAADLTAPGQFMTVDVVPTGQTWVYPVDIFLTNLSRRAGDQSRVRQCLERLAPPEPDDSPDTPRERRSDIDTEDRQ